MASLDFSNICYSVPEGKKKEKKWKTILKGINGSISAGEVVAIIGSSGAGKTTLLNILAGRIKNGKVSGEILFNGEKRVPSEFKKSVAYVEQDDVLFPDLTVRETLMYAASFRLPDSEYAREEKEGIVKDIIKSLRLTKSQDVFIGNQNIKGISGGERKRVSIGVEIISDPKMVMLDEPTSGLDSNSSENVIRLIKDITVSRNIISIASIHQPNFRTMRLFDKVILLAPGGMVYFGPTNKALEYFSSIGFDCPADDNPADFFIDIMTISNENKAELESSNARVEKLKSEWAHYTENNGDLYSPAGTKESTPASKKPSRTGASSLASTATQPISIKTTWCNNWAKEFVILLRRSWKRQFRDKSVLISYFSTAIITMLLIGFVYFKPATGIVAAQNRIGLLFILTIDIVYPIVMPLLSVIILEKIVMTRERASGSYRISSFFSSVYFTKAPILLLTNIIFLTGTYFLAKLQLSASKFFIFLAIYISGILCSLAFAFAVSSATSNVETASIIAPLILSVFVIFGGVLVNADSTTPILSWLRYISYIYYTYMAAMQNEMNGLTFDCVPSPTAACYPTGEAVIRAYSLDKVSIVGCIMINLGISIVYNFIAYLNLRFKSKPKYIWI